MNMPPNTPHLIFSGVPPLIIISTTLILSSAYSTTLTMMIRTKKDDNYDDEELVVDGDDGEWEDEDDSNTFPKPAHLYKFSELENLQKNHNRTFISIISQSSFF